MSLLILSAATPITVGAMTPFNPTLSAGTPLAVTRSSDFLAYLQGGPVTVSSELANAFERGAGNGYAEETIVKIGGAELPSHCVLEVAPITRRESDKYGRHSCRVDPAFFSYLDNAACEVGQSYRIIHRFRGQTTGVVWDKTVFLGTVYQTPATGPLTAAGGQLILAADFAVEMDREPLTIDLDLSSAPYNCVIAYVGGDCEVSQSSPISTTTVSVAAGDVLIDRTQIGKFEKFGSGGGYQYQGFPYPPGSGRWPGSGNGFGGTGIVRVSIAAQTLNLATTDVTLTGSTAPGTKSIYVRNDGVLWASDGGTPPDAVPLATVELQYEGQPLTDALIKTTRRFTLDVQYRNRSGVILFVCGRLKSYDTSGYRFPGMNDDAVSNSIHEVDIPLTQWLDAWCEPSLWRWTIDQETNALRFAVDKCKRSPDPVKLTYHAGNSTAMDVSPPDRRDASTDVTARGRIVINNGLRQRTETTLTETFAEVPEDTGVGLAGGTIVSWGSAVGKLRLVQRVKEKQIFIGSSPVLSERKVWRRRNPLNYAAGRPGPPGVSLESFMPFLYDSPQLLLDEEDTVQHVYQGRVHTGFTSEQRRYINPATHDPASVAYNATTGYGFVNDREVLTLMAVTQEKLKNGGAGYITERARVDWIFYNPHSNEEGAYAPGLAGARYGYYLITPSLIKVAEVVTRYSRFDPETVKEESWTTAWSKDPSANANAITTGISGSQSLGNVQANPIGKDHQTRIYKGNLPPVNSLADDIERIPVGYRCASTTHAVTFGSGKSVDEEHKYVETLEQAGRLAKRKYARGLALQFSVGAPANPQLLLHDSVQLDYTSRGGRRYYVRGLVTGIDYVPPKAGVPSIMTYTALVDYNEAKATLATRT